MIRKKALPKAWTEAVNAGLRTGDWNQAEELFGEDATVVLDLMGERKAYEGAEGLQEALQAFDEAFEGAELHTRWPNMHEDHVEADVRTTGARRVEGHVDIETTVDGHIRSLTFETNEIQPSRRS